MTWKFGLALTYDDPFGLSIFCYLIALSISIAFQSLALSPLPTPYLRNFPLCIALFLPADHHSLNVSSISLGLYVEIYVSEYLVACVLSLYFSKYDAIPLLCPSGAEHYDQVRDIMLCLMSICAYTQRTNEDRQDLRLELYHVPNSLSSLS